MPIYPGKFLLDENDSSGLETYLKRHSLLTPDEHVESVSKAGEGNMNCTLRVKTSSRQFIVKQSRPWVEKYEHIPAPWDRANMEARFYRLSGRIAEVREKMPKLLAVDSEDRILVMEDLGSASDYLPIYGGFTVPGAEVAALGQYLSALHREPYTREEKASFKNRAMRDLNNEHLFLFPLRQENGLDLDAIVPGLSAASEELRRDAEYRKRVEQLSVIYLSEGPCLLHGDFYPGSWLNVRGSLYVIDPEFGFFGRPEFDVGVALAHFQFAGWDERQSGHFIQSYSGPEGFDWELAHRFAGAELMRRLIGVAQLPLPYGLERRRELLELSRRWVLDGRV